jgi:hypothetical protein
MDKKRKGFEFPLITIHSKVIIVFNQDFIIYEHYGTWYLRQELFYFKELIMPCKGKKGGKK